MKSPLKVALNTGFALLTLMSTSSANAGWEIEWIDRFDGNAVNWQNWTAQVQANYNNEIQCYTDDETSEQRNLEVSNGTLKIVAHKKQVSCEGLNGQSRSWTSARLNSKDKREFLYGRIETRLKFNTLDGGVWPAFWALENRIAEHPFKGDNDTVHWPNPGAGEIDIWEWFSNQGESYITNFFNTSNCGGEYRPVYAGGASDVLDFHVYAMEWTEQEVRFFMNDNLVRTVDIANCQQYKEPMFVLINLAIGGNLGGNVDPALTTATLEVDYIAHCSASDSNALTQCNEQTPVATDSDADGISDNLDQCPDTATADSVDAKGCTVAPFQDTPTQAAPIPNLLPEDVIAIFSDEYDTIAEVNFAPNWGQATVVTIETIEDDNTLKYQGLNYQGTGFENTPQDLTAMEYVHFDYWTNNASFLEFYLVSPGPVETSYSIDVSQNEWQSVDIALASYYSEIDLSDVFQLKVVGNGTVYLDNIYFYRNQVGEDTEQPGEDNADADTGDSAANDDDSSTTDPDDSITDENSAPELNFTLVQNGQIVSAIDASAGIVTLFAEVTDADSSDSHTVNWATPEEFNGEINGNSLQFEPNQIESGQYQISASVTDNGNPSKTTEAVFTINIDAKQENSAGGANSAFFVLLIGWIAFRRVKAQKRRA